MGREDYAVGMVGVLCIALGVAATKTMQQACHASSLLDNALMCLAKSQDMLVTDSLSGCS